MYKIHREGKAKAEVFPSFPLTHLAVNVHVLLKKAGRSAPFCMLNYQRIFSWPKLGIQPFTSFFELLSIWNRNWAIHPNPRIFPRCLEVFSWGERDAPYPNLVAGNRKAMRWLAEVSKRGKNELVCILVFKILVFMILSIQLHICPQAFQI